MNSVFELPTVISNSIVHSFTSSSPSSQNWSIEMASLPFRRTYHAPSDHDDDHRSTVRSTTSSKATLRPRTFEPAEVSPSDSASDHHPVAAGPMTHNTTRHHHDPPTSPPPDPPTTASSSRSEAPTYLCTFCWRPQHSAITPCKTIGRRARLACEPCYKALLDLAVC